MSENKGNSTRKEIGLGEVLNRFLSNESFHDIKLKGSCGLVVPANRYALAARSPVFEAMLLGKFSEASGDPVNIPEYEGCILQAVVEYIHTDKPQMLNAKKRKATDDESKGDSSSVVDTKQIHTLISLAAAANFFDLPGLIEKVKDFLSSILNESPHISFALLEVCNKQKPAVPDEIAELAWSRVRSDSTLYVEDTNAVACLSQHTIEEILKDEKTEMTEYNLFCLLMSWVESSPNDLKPTAKNLVHLIRLEGISPGHLSSVVEPSGLFTSEQLFKAYKSYSVKADGFLPVSLEHSRLVPLWSKASSVVSCFNKPGNRFDVLQCPTIRTGVHQWTMEKIGSYRNDGLMFGVVLKVASLDPKEWLTCQKGNWGFQTDGKTMCEGEHDKSQPQNWTLEFGEQVTLTLDLRKNQKRNGTLSGRIEKKNGITLAIGPIANLLDQLADDAHGFLPAVESHCQGGFCVIDFKELLD